MIRHVLPFVLLLTACNTADSVSAPTSRTSTERTQTQSADWRVEITSSGGFAGRGLGSISIENGNVQARNMNSQICNGAPLSAAQRADLQRLVDAARPAAWRNVPPEPGGADMVEYTLTLRRDSESKTATWTGEDMKQLPADLAALFETTWRIRTTACS